MKTGLKAELEATDPGKLAQPLHVAAISNAQTGRLYALVEALDEWTETWETLWAKRGDEDNMAGRKEVLDMFLAETGVKITAKIVDVVDVAVQKKDGAVDEEEEKEEVKKGAIAGAVASVVTGAEGAAGNDGLGEGGRDDGEDGDDQGGGGMNGLVLEFSPEEGNKGSLGPLFKLAPELDVAAHTLDVMRMSRPLMNILVDLEGEATIVHSNTGNIKSNTLATLRSIYAEAVRSKAADEGLRIFVSKGEGQTTATVTTTATSRRVNISIDPTVFDDDAAWDNVANSAVIPMLRARIDAGGFIEVRVADARVANQPRYLILNALRFVNANDVEQKHTLSDKFMIHLRAVVDGETYTRDDGFVGLRSGAELREQIDAFFLHLAGDHSKCLAKKCKNLPKDGIGAPTVAFKREVLRLHARFVKGRRGLAADCERLYLGSASSQAELYMSHKLHHLPKVRE
jgi:hypothetical protein